MCIIDTVDHSYLQWKVIVITPKSDDKRTQVVTKIL